MSGLPPGWQHPLQRLTMKASALSAPMTTTLPLESRPSMSASRVLTMLLWIWSCLLLLTCA